MYAVIQLQGHQYIVAEGHEIQVDQLDENQDKLSCEVLMLFKDDGSLCEVGLPHVTGAQVDLKVDAKVLGEKIRVTKFKRKNRYQRTIGSRSKKHILKVQKIVWNGGK